ncbi:MAG: sigma factor, partial [bacterium]
MLVGTERLEDIGDTRLVVAIARKHTDALAEVYRRYAGAVLALARRVVGDPRLSEEVVQEVFLGLWNAPE